MPASLPSPAALAAVFLLGAFTAARPAAARAQDAPAVALDAGAAAGFVRIVGRSGAALEAGAFAGVGAGTGEPVAPVADVRPALVRVDPHPNPVVPISTVPEPATYALVGSGLALVGAAGARRGRARA